MRIKTKEKIRAGIQGGITGLLVASITLGIPALIIKKTENTVGLNENSSVRPKIELNENYKAQLVNLPNTYKVTIFDKEGNHYIVGEDVNKDTIIDNIYKKFYVKDSTLLKLTSSEELSKIEKELLEKK
jgi:hypothetical protein